MRPFAEAAVKRRRYSRSYNELRALLREARQGAGLTQRELSAKLKRDKNFVQLVESGERALDVIEFLRYAKTLGCDPRELLGKLLK
jgi:transcriptional regulator with XRE-family HTH domain